MKDREQIIAYYRSRRYLRAIAPRGYFPWKRSSDPVMREIALGVQRAYMRLAEQRITLHLTLDVRSARPWLRPNTFANELAVVRHYPPATESQSPATVSGVADLVLCSIANGIVTPHQIPIQRHWDQLVFNKGIHEAVGRCDVDTVRGEQSFYGHYVILAARELRQSWLGDKGLRAFRVAATPSRYMQQTKPCIAYVVKSELSDDINPAISGELRKAVSLAERRIRAKVLENMEL